MPDQAVVWCGRCVCGANWVQPGEPPDTCPDVGCGEPVTKWRAGIDPAPRRFVKQEPLDLFPGMQGAEP